jgi:hypothetical protein
MKQFLLAIMLVAATSANAQSKKIRLNPEAIHPENFHFNNITVIDNRLDTNVVGWVTKGVDNILVPAEFDAPASQKLSSFFKDVTGHLWNNGKHELVVHVTDLFLMEDPEMIGTVGNMDIRIQAFLKQGDTYYSIYKLDKQEPFQAFDVTQKMFKTLNTYLIDFIKTANEKFTDDLTYKTKYSWNDVLAIRQKELNERYALYKNENLKEGIYETNMEFHAQTPTWPVDELDKRIQENLAKPRRKRQAMFAYCKDGNIYFFQNIKTYETIQLYRKDNNFFKQDYGLDPKLQASSAALGWAFGLLAEAISTDASNGNRSWYEFIYNPRNGLFYHYKKLARTKEEYETSLKENNSTSVSSGTN